MTGAVAQAVLLQSPGLCFSSRSAAAERTVPMGRDVLQVAGAELAGGVQGLNGGGNELLGLTGR